MFRSREVTMKRIVSAIVIVMVVHGSSDGMCSAIDTNQQIRIVQNKFATAAVPISFDREKFESKLNPVISSQMIKLLDDSLGGDDEVLETCSERIHSGLLNNNPIFKDTSVDINQRDGFIYEISMQLLNESIQGSLPPEASIVALKNVLVYCKTKAREIGLFDMRKDISSIFSQIQYERFLRHEHF